MRTFAHRAPRAAVRAQLHAVRCHEVPDLALWRAPASFAICLELLVGPEGEPGEDAFALTVCTPDQLRTRASRDGIADGRHHLVVDHFDFASIDRYLRRRVGACEGQSWDDVTAQLARFARWSFENDEA